MGSTCRRPGCGRPAAVTIRYDPVSCQLWLDPVNPTDRDGQFLCLDHAERLSPPRGWVVVDRRGAQTALRTPTALAPRPRIAPRRTVRRRWGSFEEPTLEFTVEREPPVEAPEVPPESPVPAVPLERARAVDAKPEPPVEPQPERVLEPDPEPEPEPEPDPAAPVDDLSDLLKPRGGLLGRAFEATGHQRSALTISDEDDDQP